jgi:hypothetical protein
MRLNKIIIICIITISVYANDFKSNFNYFGNITTSAIDNDDYYIKNYHANTVTSTFKLTPYSKLGLQSTVYNDDFTFIIQTLINHRDNKSSDLTPELTWLNGKYNINDNSTIKIGRMQTALLLNADSLDVNYLHNWAKDKNIVYELVPMKFYDGVEYRYNYSFNNYILTTTIIPYGTTKTNIYEFIDGGILDVKDINILSLDLSNNDFRVKFSYIKTKFDINTNSTNYKNLINGLEANGYGTSRYNYIDKTFQQYNIGVEYNINNYQIITEYIDIYDSNSLYPKTKAFYTMIGYSIDDLTPYIMYSKNKNDEAHFKTSIPSPELETLLYTTNSSEETITLGARYEIKIGVALKIQLDRITTTDYSNDYNSITDREGYTSRYANTQQKPIYQLTCGVSFAF